MADIIWVLIPLAAIIGSFIIKYQRNKMTMMNKSQHNEQQVEEVQQLVQSLRKRIENLEAIAAGAPDEFRSTDAAGQIEIDPSAIKKENQQKVSDIASKERSRS